MNISLTVDRQELVEALKVLRRAGPGKRAGETLLTYSNGLLAIEVGGITARVSAQGEWPGQARSSVLDLIALANALPRTPYISIRVESERLHIGNWSTPCHWDETSDRMIELPLNPSLLDLLSVDERYSAEQIEKSGLTRTVNAATARRDQLVRAAAATLQPLGVEPSALEHLVQETIRRNTEP